MNWDNIQGNWDQVRGQLKQQWGKLTDQDLDAIMGKREELEGKLQKYYGFESTKAHQEVDRWLSHH